MFEKGLICAGNRFDRKSGTCAGDSGKSNFDRTVKYLTRIRHRTSLV